MQRFISLRDCTYARILFWTAAMFVVAPAYANDTNANVISESAGKSIAIKNYTFLPATKTVAQGTTVIWVNDDDDPHTVTGDGAAAGLNSPALDTHDHYSFTFAKPGVYKYFCKLHPHMQGEIIVK